MLDIHVCRSRSWQDGHDASHPSRTKAVWFSGFFHVSKVPAKWNWCGLANAPCASVKASCGGANTHTTISKNVGRINASKETRMLWQPGAIWVGDGLSTKVPNSLDTPNFAEIHGTVHSSANPLC